jgi:hypothetical protein
MTMKFKKGDRVLYNRQKFGTVHSNQFNHTEADVVFDRDKSIIVAVRVDTLELVADKHHEAVLSALINNPPEPDAVSHALAEELVKLAEVLVSGADPESNVLRMRTTMIHISHRLRVIAEGLEK